MAHGYRTLQHWNHWLAQHFLGKQVLDAEAAQMACFLNRHFGKHAVLIGVPHQYDLMKSTTIPCHSLITPIAIHSHESGFIEGDLHEIPLLTGSIDLVMLPHTLEFVDNPRQLLSEACRIIKPEGLLVVCGFNPYSAWGLQRYLSRQKKNAPWGANFIHYHKLRSWLKLADFALEKYETVLYTPPVNRPQFYQNMQFLERVGKKCFPGMGGVYILVARAKVIPLTPIKMKWKQQLSGIGISSSITGNIARQSK